MDFTYNVGFFVDSRTVEVVKSNGRNRNKTDTLACSTRYGKAVFKGLCWIVEGKQAF